MLRRPPRVKQTRGTTDMTSIPDVSPDLEAAVKRVEELSEQVTAQAKANGLLWL